MNKKDFINKIVITNNFKETQELGHDFAKVLDKGDIVCLYGDLGSGKTTFVQGLAEGLGIKQRIISPTFIIIRQYDLKSSAFAKASVGKQNSKFFYHVDLYRVGSERDLEGLGIGEIINNKNNIVVIEWAEKLKSFLSAKRIDIEFFYKKNNTRKITFRPRRSVRV